MKTLYTTLVIALLSLNGIAQIPTWEWAKNTHNTYYGLGHTYGVASDANGNAYVCGQMADSLTFGPGIVLGDVNFIGKYPIPYLVKYNASGNAVWATCAQATLGSANGVATDKFGNVFITGFFSNHIVFGPYYMTSYGYEDVFLVKYDSLGNLLWANQIGGPNSDNAEGVATDNQGNVFITGYYNDFINFGSSSLSSYGSNAYIAKFDSGGNLLWAQGATGNTQGTSVATDTSGNSYCLGSYGTTAITFGSHSVTGAGGLDFYLAKFDPSGSGVWLKSAGGIGSDSANFVTTNKKGNIFITGNYSSPVFTIGTHVLNRSSSGRDMFTAEYDPSGNVVWAKHSSVAGAAASFDINGWGIRADDQGSTYILGGYQTDSIAFDTVLIKLPGGTLTSPLYLLKYDSLGNALWAKTLACGGYLKNGIALGNNGNIYIGSGFYFYNIAVGSDTLVAQHRESPYIAKLSQCNVARTSISNTSCRSYTYNGITYTSTGLYHQVYSSVAGCDSVLDLHININTVNVGVTLSGITLYANAPGDIYYWVDCNNGYAEIPGETNQTFTPTTDGTYAVMIQTPNGCVDTSACYSINNLGIVKILNTQNVSIFPNPATTSFTVSSTNKIENIKVFNILGDVIRNYELGIKNNNSVTIDISSVSKGMYFVQITDEKKTVVNKKVVVQ